jgi:hypothetical protein
MPSLLTLPLTGWFGTTPWLGYPFTIIGYIEAAPLEDNGNGVNDTACFALALGTYGYRLFVKPLLPLKVKMTGTTLILINRH